VGTRVAAHADPAVQLDQRPVVAHLARLRDLDGMLQLVPEDGERLLRRERLPDVDAQVTASVAGVQQRQAAVD
jgi:hypothetical protein